MREGRNGHHRPCCISGTAAFHHRRRWCWWCWWQGEVVVVGRMLLRRGYKEHTRHLHATGKQQQSSTDKPYPLSHPSPSPSPPPYYTQARVMTQPQTMKPSLPSPTKGGNNGGGGGGGGGGGMVVQMKKPLLPKHVRLSTSDLTSHLGPRLQAALAAAHDAALAHDSDALKQVRSSKAAAVAPSTLHLSPPLTLTTLTTHHSGGVRRPCCRFLHGRELPPDRPRPAAFRRAHSARQHPPRAAAGRRASGRAASARAGRGDGQPHPTETALRAALAGLAAALGATSWGRERQRRRQGEWWWWRWWGGCGSSAGQEAKAAEPQQRLRDRLCEALHSMAVTRSCSSACSRR